VLASLVASGHLEYNALCVVSRGRSALARGTEKIFHRGPNPLSADLCKGEMNVMNLTAGFPLLFFINASKVANFTKSLLVTVK
jgi:hypothetical protein